LEKRESQDPSPGIVAQVLSKEKEEDLGQVRIMPGSCESTHREPSCCSDCVMQNTQMLQGEGSSTGY